MLAFAKRLALETEDFLRYDPRVRGLVSRIQRWRDRLPPDDPQAVARSIVRLSAAGRLASSESSEAHLQALIRERVARLDMERLDWHSFTAYFDDRIVWKSAILKPHV